MSRLYRTLPLLAFLIASCSDSGDEAPALPTLPGNGAPATPSQSSSAAPAQNQSAIFVSNYPLSYFVSRIAGNDARMLFPNIQGDPASWVPKETDLPALQNTRVILINGAGYEKWVDVISLPTSTVTDTSLGFADNYLSTQTSPTHSHGPSGDHAHSGTAFTTWLDFAQAAQQAEAVRNALVDAQIIDAQQADAALASLTADLLALDKNLKNITAKNNSLPLIVSHPVYDYFARRYDLNVQPVLWEPGIAPTEDQWTSLQEILKTHPAEWMIWESEPLPDTVNRLLALGLQSVVFDPSGNRPTQGDFLSIMQKNVENLKPVFTSK
jgi:zinc transport system substrate-binding protein